MSGPGFRIWIDADAAPRDVKEIVFRAAKRLGIEAVMVANQPLARPPRNPLVSSVHVSAGADEADRYIADNAEPGDLAITADIPLAAILVEKEVVVLDPRGERYDAENVRQRLSVRDFMDELRGAGVTTGGPAPYGARDKRLFAAALDRTLTALSRRSR